MRASTKILLAGAVLLSAPAAADTYFYRPKPAVIASDMDPDPVEFPAVRGAEAGKAVVSAKVRVSGHDGVDARAMDGAEIRACPTEACAGDPAFTGSSVRVAKDAWVQLRATAPAGGTEKSFGVQYGTRTASWTVGSALGTQSLGNMGITHAGLRAALSTRLGASDNWILCSEYGSGGAESCKGARETLVLYTATATAAEFGLWVAADLASNIGDSSPTGFYFSSAGASRNYLVDRDGAANAYGTIPVSGARLSTALWLFDTTEPWSYSAIDNNNARPAVRYRAGFNLTGGSDGQAVKGTLRWFKRR